MTSLPNQRRRAVQAGSTDNTVGGSYVAVGQRHLGQHNNGITIGNYGTSGNVVAYNFIGTDSANDTGLGNSTAASSFSATRTAAQPITRSAPSNVISGNSYAGIGIYDTGTSDNVVAGNLIGTNDQGTAALANGIGVIISDSASSNTIGGTPPPPPMSSRATRLTASR